MGIFLFKRFFIRCFCDIISAKGEFNMKKQMSLFIWAITLLGITPVIAATNSGTRAASSADLTGQPAVRERTQVNYQKYETRTSTKTYDEKDAKNIYYTQPANRSQLYKQYASGNNSGTTVRTTRSETYTSELKRKYFLAHPFFQPLKGKFGSVTDLSYVMSSYDLQLTPLATGAISDPNGKWDMGQFSIKEDFSYGITDRIAVLAMLQYDISNYKFDWSTAPDDTMDDSGLNMFGLGAQWRFVDNEDWIATLSGYYQHQNDISNNFLLDLKGGYKVASSTIYGVVRGWYVALDGNSYGNGIEGTTAEGMKSTLFLAYNTDVDNLFYVEGGVGIFSVLDEDWTLNFEGLIGNYDWHNQASLKAAIGWQPNDWVALNLYAKTAVYDSADGKALSFWATDADTGAFVRMGTANIDNYSETSVGLQATFLF